MSTSYGKWSISDRLSIFDRLLLQPAMILQEIEINMQQKRIKHIIFYALGIALNTLKSKLETYGAEKL